MRREVTYYMNWYLPALGTENLGLRPCNGVCSALQTAQLVLGTQHARPAERKQASDGVNVLLFQ